MGSGESTVKDESTEERNLEDEDDCSTTDTWHTADESTCEEESARNGILDLQVDCFPRIHHSNIAAVLYKYHGTLSDVDRRLLQETMKVVTEERRHWVMEDSQITVNGKNLRVVFQSGEKTNKYVGHLDGQDRLIQRVDEKGWRLCFYDCIKDFFMKIWSCIKEVVKMAGAIVGVTKKAIGMCG